MKCHKKLYLKVWIALLVLTVVTVLTSEIHFGANGKYNLLIAMFIATVKGALVCLYFMHLKDDSNENRVVFFSSFFFLLIFVGLTASDLWVRESERPMVVQEQSEAFDVDQALAGSDELMAKGKELFAQQCAVCHGAEGKGDGIPGARNFTVHEWKKGGGLVAVFKSITTGLPGTAMAGFGERLSVMERFAVAHFVRSFNSNPQMDNPGEVEAIKTELALKSSSGAGSVEEKKGPRIPIDFAVERMLQEK